MSVAAKAAEGSAARGAPRDLAVSRPITLPVGAPGPVGVPIENNRGQRIVTLADWRRLAPPASPRHWREYRSAFELAHAWTEGDGAHQLQALLAARQEFAALCLERAIAKRKSWFDDIPGGPRNHDLLLLARATARPVVVGIEAKADETFDRDLAGFLVAARRRQPSTRAPERLDRLTRAFFGMTLADDPPLAPVRYQLLSALAGTLAEAKHFSALAAVLVVHEFVTPETDPIKQRRNAGDLDAFLARLGTAPKTAGLDGSWLAGPYRVPGNPHLPGDVPIYVGKLVTRVERRSDGPRPPCGGTPVPQIPQTITGDPTPNAEHDRRPERRHRTTITIPSGSAVVKLNVHPVGCPCECKSNPVVMLNRPGHKPPGTHRRTDLDDAVRQVHDWARDILQNPEPDIQNPSSNIDTGRGEAIITLTVHPAGTTPRFTTHHLGTGEHRATDDLRPALSQIRDWTGEALGRR
jgi:hypothetical protein